MRAVGVLLNSTGQVIQNLASVLMCLGQQPAKRADANSSVDHADPMIPADPDGDDDCRSMRWCWYVGVVLLVLGALCVFASYPFAEQSLLGALISLQFISNIAFGRLLLGADISFKALLGTLVVICGTTLCVSSAPKINPGHHHLRIEELWMFALDNPPLWRFLIADCIVWLGLHELGRLYSEAKKSGAPLMMSNFVEPFTFIAKAAIPGAFSIVAAKNLSIIIAQYLRGHAQLTNPFLYLNLFIWLSGTSLWMRRMNAALGTFDGLFIIPLCQVTWSLCTILSGGFFFREFQSFDVQHLLAFGCGVCWNFLGVFLLQPPSGAREPTRVPSLDGCNPPVVGDHAHPWWMGLARAGMQPCGITWKKERTQQYDERELLKADDAIFLEASKNYDEESGKHHQDMQDEKAGFVHAVSDDEG